MTINASIPRLQAESATYLALLMVWLPIGALLTWAEPTLAQSPGINSSILENSLDSNPGSNPGSVQSLPQDLSRSATSPTLTPDAIPPSIQTSEAYTLGAGDRIHLDFFNIPEYTEETQVLADGSLNLPLVGNVSVQGMTLRETADAIQSAYYYLLRNPIVTVSLIRPRPLRVSIAGEINRPGSYAMSLSAESADAADFQWPTVTQVIQTAGGITQQADVSQIKIERIQRLGESQEIKVNLWELLKEADLSQDIQLRDGDNIVIPIATSVQPAEATQLSTASFAPNTIRVSVVGEVITPGIVEVPPNTPLNQALLAAGGFDQSRARKSRVELVRLNPDGTVTQQTLPIDFAQGISEDSNPILRNNDVIVVGRSDTARFSDSVNGVLETLGRILPFFVLF